MLNSMKKLKGNLKNSNLLFICKKKKSKILQPVMQEEIVHVTQN